MALLTHGKLDVGRPKIKIVSGVFVSFVLFALGALLVRMAPEVAGRVIEVNFIDNQKAKAGDVLFRIDPQPFWFDFFDAHRN